MIEAPSDPVCLTVRSDDGATVVARVFAGEGYGAVPATVDSMRPPVCLVLPAMGVAASFYEPLALALAEIGLTAVTLDLRGQGESNQKARKGARFGYRQIVELDLPCAVDTLRRQFDARPIVVVGHSLGGQLATIAVGTGQLHVDGLVLIAAGVAHWRTWQGVARLKSVAGILGIAAVSRVLPWYPGRALGFGGDQPRTLMRDWTHNALFGRYRSCGSATSLEPTIPARGIPCLALQIPGDFVAPAGAMRALLSRIDPGEVVWDTIPAIAGADPWRRHFYWVREPQSTVDAMCRWLGNASGVAAPSSVSPSSADAPLAVPANNIAARHTWVAQTRRDLF